MAAKAAKKARRKNGAKGRAKSARRTVKAKTRKAAAPKRKTAARKKRARKATLGERLSGAVRTMIGAVEDTEKMRRRLEPRGSDETQ